MLLIILRTARTESENYVKKVRFYTKTIGNYLSLDLVYVVSLCRLATFCRLSSLSASENMLIRCDLVLTAPEIASSFAVFTDFCCRFNVLTESI